MKSRYYVDGYNLIHADKALREAMDISLEEARLNLEDMLSGYSKYIDKKIVVVYDGHMVKDNRGESYEKDELTIVFTKENETADSYIERASYELADRYQIYVVTNDLAERNLTFNEGAVVIGSRAFIAKIHDSLNLEKKMHERKMIREEVAYTNDLQSQLLKWLNK